MSSIQSARSITPSAAPVIPHYVNAFNKTTGERKQLQQVTVKQNPLLARIQFELDVASALANTFNKVVKLWN